MLTRDAILAAQDFKTVDVEVPEWGGSLRLRTLSVAGRDAVQAAATDLSGKVNPTRFAALLIVRTAIDESGQRLFSDEEANVIAEKGPEAFQRVFDAASKLNGFGAESVDAAEKNSSPAQSGSSSSDSPAS
jgi:hypothetical protein